MRYIVILIFTFLTVSSTAINSSSVVILDVDNYGPPGSGGGGNTTTYVSINNYITNNQFIDHIDDTAVILPTNLVIAPSNHKGFTPAPSSAPVVDSFGVVGPDIRFVKNNTNASDQITFPLFPFGTQVLTGDVTPVDYVRYVCTNSPTNEQYKSFQFPITQKVNNLANKIMTFDIWAAVAATPATLSLYTRQYFSSAATASNEVRTLRGTMNLTTTWTRYPIQFTVPNVSTKNIGALNAQTDDDALYIQLQMPLGQPCDIFFTKPVLYLGEINPNADFDSYDQINSINSTPRTGDIRVSLTPTPPRGWVAMDDKTIGNNLSGATGRPNKDTFQLYSTIYTSVSNAWAPVSGTGRTPPGNTMQNAITDFLANKTLTLPKSLGRALAGAGSGALLTPRVLGENAGTETTPVSLVAGNLPAHNHVYQFPVSVALGGGSININAGTGGPQFTSGGPTNPPTPFNVPIVSPTSFMNIFIKL